MLRLRSSIQAHLLYYTATSSGSSLQRLLYATAPRIVRYPRFAVDEYLVDTCGLTRAQALKASRKLLHLKSPTNADAVLAFLADLDLSGTDVAALVAKDPLFLCTSVDNTLAPVVVGLTGLGLSRSEIARLSSVAPFSFRNRSTVSNLPYYLLLYGSFKNLLRALKWSYNLLGCSLEKVVKPIVAFLQECGLDACDIAKLCIARPWLPATNLERVQAMVACAKAVGVPCGSGMFRLALQAVAYLSEEKIAARVEYLKNTFRWSDDEVGIAVCKHPMVLALSKDILQSKSEFLISEVGLEPAYIAQLPAFLGYSLEGRLRPRYYVVKFLKENGFLDRHRSYYSAVTVTEKYCLLLDHLRTGLASRRQIGTRRQMLRLVVHGCRAWRVAEEQFGFLSVISDVIQSVHVCLTDVVTAVVVAVVFFD